MNIVSIVPKPTDPEVQPGYLRIFYTDGTDEILQVDSFGIAEEMPGYLTLWSDTTEGPVGFLSHNSIKKIMTLETVSENDSNS